MIASLETKEHFIPDPALVSEENEVKINHPPSLFSIHKAVFFLNGGEREYRIQFMRHKQPPHTLDSLIFILITSNQNYPLLFSINYPV